MKAIVGREEKSGRYFIAVPVGDGTYSRIFSDNKGSDDMIRMMIEEGKPVKETA